LKQWAQRIALGAPDLEPERGLAILTVAVANRAVVEFLIAGARHRYANGDDPDV